MKPGKVSYHTNNRKSTLTVSLQGHIVCMIKYILYIPLLNSLSLGLCVCVVVYNCHFSSFVLTATVMSITDVVTKFGFYVTMVLCQISILKAAIHAVPPTQKLSKVQCLNLSRPFFPSLPQHVLYMCTVSPLIKIFEQ